MSWGKFLLKSYEMFMFLKKLYRNQAVKPSLNELLMKVDCYYSGSLQTQLYLISFVSIGNVAVGRLIL